MDISPLGGAEDQAPQEKIFERHGVDISRKTMGGWLAQCAHLLQPLYGSSLRSRGVLGAV